MAAFGLDSRGKGVYHCRMSLLPESAMLLLSGGAAIFNPLPQYGDAGYKNHAAHCFQLCYENDASFDDDCNYSHGTRLNYAQEFKEGMAWGVSLMQNIYTPETHTRGAVPDEHPYAGTLALGGALLVRGAAVGSCTEFQLGATGDASLARYVQNGVHEMGNMDKWNGWGDQVPAEMTFQLTQRMDVDLPFVSATWGDGWGTDALLMARADVGTVMLACGTGVSFRIGKNLPDSMQVLGNSAGNYGVGLITKPEYRRQDASYFLVASVYTEYVARDITIDGGVFHHFDQTCSRVPWQVEGRIGLGVSYHGIDYYGGVLLRSDSYRTQQTPCAMSSFSIGWRW